MGYYKDNFPGSPAAAQRLRVARGLIIYSIIFGFGVLKFAPASRRFDKEIAEGREPYRSEFLDFIVDRIRSRGPVGPKIPTTEQLIHGRQERELLERSDLQGPYASPELIKKTRG